MNGETITGTLSWYKILLLNGSNHIRAKINSSHETEESFVKILGAVASTESCKFRQPVGIWERM